MPSGQYVALGAVADAIGNEFAKRRDQAHAEEVKNQDLIKNLVTAGMQSGQISNPQQAFEWMVQQYGGSKGKGGKAGKGGSGGGLPQPLQTLIGAIQQGSQQGNGSPAASGAGPQFTSPAQAAQTAEDQKIREARRLETEVTGPARAKEAATQHGYKLEEDAARLGPVDKATRDRAQQLAAAANDAGNWQAYLQPAAEAIGKERTQKADLSKYPPQMREKISELVAKGIPEDRAPAVAAQALETERAQKAQQASQRLGAYLNMSRVNLVRNQEAYNEMKESFPYLLASRMANADSADSRSAIEAYKAATTGTVDPAKAQKAAASIVSAATKQAATLAGKQNSVAMALGIDSDEATIRQNLIREMSGGQDPAEVEKQAKANVTPAARPAASTHKKDDVVTLKDGTKHKVLRVQTDGRLVLDPSPAP